MLSVALIGPDGAGKTTVGRQLEHLMPAPVKYIYMGMNLGSSSHMLPTTWLIRSVKRACGDTHSGARSLGAIDVRPPTRLRRAVREVRSGLALINRICEEWFRQAVAWTYQRRGNIVIFDRHFYADNYAYDIANPQRERALTGRLHGFVLNKMYPRPDLTIYLDAPAEVLFARKGEGTLGTLEKLRQSYLEMSRILQNFTVVDGNRPEHEVVRDVAMLISEWYRRRAGTATRLGRSCSH